MKVCFFGLGSIGKKHLVSLTNISKLFNLELEIHAFRSSCKSSVDSDELIVNKQIYKYEELETYDIIFVTNPTYLHYETIMNTNKNTYNFFIEKPVFESTKHNLQNLDLQSHSIYYVACPLRHNPVIEYLQKIIPNEKIFSVRCICSSYLPEWRKNLDYRLIYSSIKEKGGGVTLDLIHEIDYITYLFGLPIGICNYKNKYSNLEINSDDLSVYIMKYSDKIVELHLDYFGRYSQRKIELYTENDVIVGDLINNRVTYMASGEETTFEKEDMYIKEMKYFMEHVLKGEKTFNEIDHAFKVLKVSQGEIE